MRFSSCPMEWTMHAHAACLVCGSMAQVAEPPERVSSKSHQYYRHRYHRYKSWYQSACLGNTYNTWQSWDPLLSVPIPFPLTVRLRHVCLPVHQVHQQAHACLACPVRWLLAQLCCVAWRTRGSACLSSHLLHGSLVGLSYGFVGIALCCRTPTCILSGSILMPQVKCIALGFPATQCMGGYILLCILHALCLWWLSTSNGALHHC